MNQSETENRTPSMEGTPERAALPPDPPQRQPYPYLSARRKSPAVAGILSMMTGLGQIYVGYYVRGFSYAAIFASVIALLSAGAGRGLEPLLGIFLGFFWLYSIIDAVRLASLYNDRVLSGGRLPESLPQNLPSPGGALFGGILLAGIGVLFLARSILGISLEWLADWWPVILVLFGAYLIRRGIQERRDRDGGS